MISVRQKLFVSAYACEPNLGSEIGVGWHWVLEMSRYFELWVLTRENNRESVEPWIAKNPEFDSIHFLYYDLPKWARFWKKGMRGVRTYYNIWQIQTNRIVKKTMRENNIQVFHHLTYGNALWKVNSYGQKQFFVWGPIGGLETISADYTRHYNQKSRLIEWLRRVVIRFLPINRGFKNRCKNANLILCKTDITREHIPLQYRDKAVLFTDVAVELKQQFNKIEQNSNGDKIKYIIVGRLDAWRGFDLTIMAFAEAVEKNSNIHLSIIGKGDDNERLKSLIRKYKMEEFITMVGKVSMGQYYQMLHQSDVVINSSLKEGAVTVSFDSMAMGKPLICLDTKGYTHYFSNDYAIVIPIRERHEVIQDLTNAILRMTDLNERKKMGEKAKQEGQRFTWETKGYEFYKLLSSKL